MKPCMLTFSLFLYLLISLPIHAYSAPIPEWLRSYLEQKNRSDIIEQAQTIPVVSPKEFLEDFFYEFSKANYFILGSGFNGTIIGKSLNGKKTAYKFSNAIFAALGKAELIPGKEHLIPEGMAALKNSWQKLELVTKIRSLNIRKQTFNTTPLDRYVGAASLVSELYGNLLWQIFHPKGLKNVSSITMISNDGRALRMDWVIGKPLSAILQKNREENPLGSAQTYDLLKIFKELILYLEASTQMSLETGYTVDMLNSGNFILTEAGGLHKIDNQIIRPSQETISALLEESGKKDFPDLINFHTAEFYIPEYPTHPTNLVSGIQWGLSLPQALTFMVALHKIDQAYEKEKGKKPDVNPTLEPIALAFKHLAETKKWPIYPNYGPQYLEDFSNITQAEAAWKDCSHLFNEQIK